MKAFSSPSANEYLDLMNESTQSTVHINIECYGCGMRRWDATAAVSVGQYWRLPKQLAKVDGTVNSMVGPMAASLCPWEAGVLIIMLLTLITLPWILMRSLHFTLSPAGVVLVVSCVRQSLSRDEHLIPGITDLIRSCGADWGEWGVKLLH